MLYLLKKVRERLMEEEGFKENWYLCKKGKKTIGHGLTELTDLEVRIVSFLRNTRSEFFMLEPISEFESEVIVGYRVEKLEEALRRNSWYYNLDTSRKAVILDMAYNMGLQGLYKFENMIAALNRKNYEQATKEIVNSLYYTQLKNRADRNIKIMLNLE